MNQASKSNLSETEELYFTFEDFQKARTYNHERKDDYNTGQIRDDNTTFMEYLEDVESRLTPEEISLFNRSIS